ncbi:hypothetical protein JCGZ_20243 [Jatropha curcas]|uniref:Uncharacterized protein n=1 Tax=Jatropha curcas TaxID=180498 RepID=A0A067K575_JATCU|nr:hypothetical protein JCGZ_20243 [Jatropha curcas]
MDGRFVCSSEHSSPCLPIEPFEHKGKMYPGLKIFAYVINILAVESKESKSESEKEQKEEEKELEQEGFEGPQAAEEEEKKKEKEEKGQVAQVKERGDTKKKASTSKEEEDPAEQVLKAIRACINESFEEAKASTDVFISV